MTMARARLVDPSVTRWYHCITRCVRRAFLLGEGPKDRKQWIENRIEELSRIFSISVGGFSILDNHLHLLLRLDLEPAAQWSDEDVARRWGRLFPPRDKSNQPIAVSKAWLDEPSSGRGMNESRVPCMEAGCQGQGDRDRSQSYQPSSPSPRVAETRTTSSAGLTWRA